MGLANKCAGSVQNPKARCSAARNQSSPDDVSDAIHIQISMKSCNRPSGREFVTRGLNKTNTSSPSFLSLHSPSSPPPRLAYSFKSHLPDLPTKITYTSLLFSRTLGDDYTIERLLGPQPLSLGSHLGQDWGRYTRPILA